MRPAAAEGRDVVTVGAAVRAAATGAVLAILLLVPFLADITNEALESARQPAPPR
jgi:hypothetical protein